MELVAKFYVIFGNWRDFMSRIGKLPIKIPTDVIVTFTDLQISVKGKFGLLHNTLPNCLSVKQDNGILIVNLENESKTNRALHGLHRSLINNMIIGVSEQFTIRLDLVGVGYRGIVQGKELILNLGYSHQVIMQIQVDSLEKHFGISQNQTIQDRIIVKRPCSCGKPTRKTQRTRKRVSCTIKSATKCKTSELAKLSFRSYSITEGQHWPVL